MEAEKNEAAPVTARREFEGHTPGLTYDAHHGVLRNTEGYAVANIDAGSREENDLLGAQLAAAPALLRERDELRAALEAYVAYYHGTRELDPDISSDRLGIAARAALSAARS